MTSICPTIRCEEYTADAARKISPRPLTNPTSTDGSLAGRATSAHHCRHRARGDDRLGHVRNRVARLHPDTTRDRDVNSLRNNLSQEERDSMPSTKNLGAPGSSDEEADDFPRRVERATRGLLALNVSILERIEKRIGLAPLRALQSLERLGPSLVTELGADLDLLPSTASRLSDRLAEAGSSPAVSPEQSPRHASRTDRCGPQRAG